MRVIRSLFLSVIFLLILCDSGLCFTVPDDTIVYVTPYGEKYHREDCTYTEDVTSMTIRKAERSGYEPCSRCHPDIHTGKYVSNWDGDSSSYSSSRSGPDKPNSSLSRGPWYASPLVAILIIVLMGVFVKFIVSFIVSYRRSAYQNRQKYLESLRKKAQFETERQEYQKLYGGKDPRTLVNMPHQYEIGPDDFPKEVGAAKDWGPSLTVYLSASGQCYHKRPGCSGAHIPVNIFDDRLLSKRPCGNCRPENRRPSFRWYSEYKRIQDIKETYKID